MSSASYRCVYLLGPEQLEIREIEQAGPGSGEILVQIDAATTCGTDLKVFRRGGHPRMLTPPSPFGHEMAATLIEIGHGVTGWKPGERVVVANSASCGSCEACASRRENLCEELVYLNGAFAERLLVPASFVAHSLHRIPGHMPSVLAALTEPLACIVHGYETMRLEGERDVLVIGGGPMGLMFAHLLALHRHRVTLTDPNVPRLQTARRLGAIRTHLLLDRDKPALELGGLADRSSGFEVTIDVTGTVSGWTAAIETAQPGAVVNFFGGCAPGTQVPLDTSRVHYHELTLLGCYHHRPPNFERALEILSEEGAPLSHLVSFETPLENVEQALRAMSERRALKVALKPNQDSTVYGLSEENSGSASIPRPSANRS